MSKVSDTFEQKQLASIIVMVPFLHPLVDPDSLLVTSFRNIDLINGSPDGSACSRRELRGRVLDEDGHGCCSSTRSPSRCPPRSS